jgi:hypothetical protein
MPIYDLTIANGSDTSPLFEVVGRRLLPEFTLPLVNWDRSGTKLLVVPVPSPQGRKLFPGRLRYQFIPNFPTLLTKFVQDVITTTRRRGITICFSEASVVAIVDPSYDQPHRFVLRNLQDTLKLGLYQQYHIEAAEEFLDAFGASFEPNFDLSHVPVYQSWAADQEKANNLIIDGVMAQLVANLQDEPSDRDLALLRNYLAGFYDFTENTVLPTNETECDRLMALIEKLPEPYWFRE